MAKLEDMVLEKIKPEKFGDFDRIQDEFLPYLDLNSEQVPEVHNWEPKHTYRMVIDIRQDDMRVDKITGRVSAGFKIVKYKVIEAKSIEDMTDTEFGVQQGKELSKVASQNASSLSGRMSD